jgi:hypothetical protein
VTLTRLIRSGLVHTRRSLTLLLVPLLARPAAAQYAATQDASLRGFRHAVLYVSISADDLAPDSATALGERIRLELGTAGLVLVGDQSDHRVRPDGVLRVALAASARGRWVDDLVVRLQVEQTAVLPRTGEALRMVTWYAEQHEMNVPATEIAPRARLLLQRSSDRFLKAWLAANGR